MRTERKPAEVFHVGVFIAEELDARNWTVEGLADATQERIRGLQAVVDGTQRLGASQAILLATLTGITAEFWMNLQMQYDRQAAQP